MATIKAKSAQEFVPIQEIRDGIVIMKDGTLKAILMTSSVNFALKSADEQEAIIMQYQNFLNSLDFSVQIFLQSRKLNINSYLDLLRDAEKNQTNELLKIQTREYIEFVKNFVESSNIMTKNFYVVVGYQPPLFKSAKGALDSLLGSVMPNKSAAFERISDENFEEYKTQLWQRVDTVSQGLIRTGIRLAPLNTEELIELYYDLFNPGELEKGKAPEMGGAK
ncbi:hypothetical protein HYW53_01235 [Candidatus Giovannonibacteria bacterium]|nr:hypothetical protein [Candidatus Giovannonibacteria bacterium]